MGSDYPEHLLARAAAPPYDGEGPFALWHFSEDPSLGQFRPHTPAANGEAPPLVWAVDTRHAPMFWFPRDCPIRWSSMILRAGLPVPASSFGSRRRSGRSGGGLRAQPSSSAVPGCVTAPRTRTGSCSARYTGTCSSRDGNDSRPAGPGSAATVGMTAAPVRAASGGAGGTPVGPS